MGRISSVHRQTLFEIAREAYGSGLTEGSRGGRGYMGLNEDFEHKYQGREKKRVFKFLTHWGENAKSLSEWQWEQIDKSTDFLRRELLDIARDAGDDVLKNVRAILKVNRRGKPKDEAPRLLERKVVAKVVSEIAKADKTLGGGRFWTEIGEHRARSLADTSVNTVLSALERDLVDDEEVMWRDQLKVFVDIAKAAYGSGTGEGTKGGRGCMGVFVDKKDRAHAAKFLTHVGESTKDLAPWQWKELDEMTDNLRFFLLDVAEQAGEETLRRVRSILKVDEADKPTAETPRLLERKVVAQAVTVIAEACDISNGFLNWGFSWKQIAAEPREPAEKDTSPKAVLERLGAKQEAIGEGWTVIEGENDSDWVLDKKAIEFLTKLIRAMPGYIDGLKDELRKLKSIMTNFPTKNELVTRIKELRVEALIMETALKNTSAAPETDAETRRKFLQDVRAFSEEVGKLLYEAMMRMPDSAFGRTDVAQAGVVKDVEENEKVNENHSEADDSEVEDGSILADDDDEDC